uniref:Aldehyde dehydrogenase domain-containing protein n=1 Tax=Noctiluca scintillans TaxID=2966 RepID=A0A7S1ANL2_NOCSC|mmetsp:Transcript_53629/g.143434  ORF Transcript_53629/g.143434 Transcript_53629/m.143434 type:complete len:564 (+) Transcript_53629:66-1757(+)
MLSRAVHPSRTFAASRPLALRALSLRRFAAKHGDPFPTGIQQPAWATMNPETLSGTNPATLSNLCNGEWAGTREYLEIPDPMNGEPFIQMPNTKGSEIDAFAASAATCSKTGLHNPLKNPERYIMYGEIFHQAGHELSRPEVMDYFAWLIARVMPKGYYQAWYEVKVTADFLKNFGGDNCRFNAGGIHVSGDHAGQESRGYRWPFGPVAIVAPFNFPLEIPGLQLGGALMMGNKPTLKCASTVSIVMEQFVRMLIHCGMPASDMDMVHCGGRAMGELISKAPFRVTQFTGSSGVAERLAKELHGKIKVEDAGFDWKIFGPDVQDFDYVAWQCDQDAYACSGQKCSAQSIAFIHENWMKAGLVDRMKETAATRKLENLSVGPVLSHTTEEMLSHISRLLEIPGAYVAFGGKELQNHTTPKIYGMLEPTAVFVPIKEALKPEHFGAVMTEIFGPFQVLTSFDDDSLHLVLEACERMSHHLTAAVVSNDVRFQDRVLAHTVNGTTYSGIRARTTGAPQNHWFGPAGDPRGAGIGSPYAIQLVWSCHREIIQDHGEIPAGWKQPPPS